MTMWARRPPLQDSIAARVKPLDCNILPTLPSRVSSSLPQMYLPRISSTRASMSFRRVEAVSSSSALAVMRRWMPSSLAYTPMVGVPGGEEGCDHFVEAAFAEAEGLYGAGNEDAARYQLLELGGDLLVPHALHLAGRARHADDRVCLRFRPTSRARCRGGCRWVGRRV